MRGDGTLDLTANNTYTGPTTVSGIVLRLSNTAALSSGNVTLTAAYRPRRPETSCAAWQRCQPSAIHALRRRLFSRGGQPHGEPGEAPGR